MLLNHSSCHKLSHLLGPPPLERDVAYFMDSPVVKKLVVRTPEINYIYPTFNVEPTQDLLADQFASRPTGSTTAAVISIIQNITQLLETKER